MVEASINTPFQLLRICWEPKYIPLQNEFFPGTCCSADTLTDAAGPFCCETQQPQFSQEGKSPAEDYKGMRKANRQAHTMRTLFQHLGPAPHLKETLLWEFSERAAQGSEGESKFSLSPALPAVPGCGSRARTSSSADLAGASPSGKTRTLRRIGGHGGTPLPGTSGPWLCLQLLFFPKSKFPLTSVAQTARPFKGLQKGWFKQTRDLTSQRRADN